MGKARAPSGPSLERRYEGPEVLGRLLSKAGSTLSVQQAIERLAEALSMGLEPPAVFPGLLPKVPRFGGPEDALRTYGNLFGVWDLLEAGTDPAELLEPRPPAPPEPAAAPPPTRIELPPRGSVPGRTLPAEVVEGTWQALADLSPRERTRRQDRYQNLQPELSEWARTATDLSPGAQETLEFLCFELEEMADRAFGDRLGAVRFSDLERSSGTGEEQPHALAYVIETLDEAVDEDEEPLPHAERGPVEDRVRRVLSALTIAVRD